MEANLCNLCNKILKYSCDFLAFTIELWSARLSQHKNVHIISLTDARALHADSRIHTKEGAVLVEMILLVKNLLTVIATDFALQIIVSIIDNAIRITFDIHAIIRVLSSIRIFSSAFYPPSAFSHPRFILHPHFLIRVLSSIRIFSSAFYPPSAFSHPYFLIRHPYPPSVSAIRIRHPYPPSVSAIRIRIRIRVLSLPFH